MKKILFVIGCVIIVTVAWYLLSPIWRVKIVNDVSPLAPSAISSSQDSEAMQSEDSAHSAKQDMLATARIIAEAPFVRGAHDVQGKALLIEQNGKHILRFENFNTINGPDLYIYLSTGLGLQANSFIDLGRIKATRGNVNYALDDSVDITKYRTVMVWCKAFGVLFSSASF